MKLFSANGIMRYQLTKSSKLCKRFEYKKVQENSICHFGIHVIVEYRYTQQTIGAKLGITATKRFGKAHERNRFKRIAREAFRLYKNNLPDGLEMILKPRSRAKHITAQEIIRELSEFSTSLNFINKK